MIDTKEFTDAWEKLFDALLKSSITCDESKIEQYRIEVIEALETLARQGEGYGLLR